MKVIQLADGFYPLVGGGSIAVRTWVENMPDIDFEIVTNALHGEKLVEKYPLSDNCVIRRFLPRDVTYASQYTGKKKMMYYPYKIISDWIRFSRKIRYLQKTDYDILHFNGPITNYGFFMFDRTLGRSCLTKLNNFSTIDKPKVLVWHGMPSEFTNNKADIENENRMINMFENIVCIKRHVYSKIKSCIEGTGLHKNLWHVPNSIDTNAFSYLPQSNGKVLRIGFVGRLAKENGINLLTNLMKHLLQSSYNYELHIAWIGSITPSEIFKFDIRDHRIHFYSNLSHKEMPGFYHKIDILLNAIRYFGVALATLEAMSCGRPVIMIKKGDRHPVTHKKTGFLIDEDINQLLQLLKYLHENREILIETGKNASDIIKREFDHSVIIPKIKGVYETLLRE